MLRFHTLYGKQAVWTRSPRFSLATKAKGTRNSRRAFWRGGAAALFVVGLTTWTVRGLSWWQEPSDAKVDCSQVVVQNVANEVPKSIEILVMTDGQCSSRVLVDSDKYSNFVVESAASLEESRRIVIQDVTASLQTQISEIFASIRGDQVSRFADFYFAYPTTYRLLREVSICTSLHLIRPSSVSLEVAICQHLEAYLSRHFFTIAAKTKTHPQK